MNRWKEFVYPERVSFSDGWDNEADFDKWLVSEDGLQCLYQATGIDVDDETIVQQASVGSFSADIFAKDTDGAVVIIENQQGKADHDHFGKLIAYASGLAPEGTCHLVWIAEEIRDEFRAALNWQNLRTESEVSFFGIEAGLLKVDKFLMPSLKVVCEPNNWLHINRHISEGDLSNAERMRLNFWTKLLEEFSARRITLFNRKSPSKDHWLSTGAGVSGCSWNLNFLQNAIRVSLYLNNQKEMNEFLLQRMQTCKDQIEESFGAELSWHLAPNNKFSSIEYAKPLENSFDDSTWDALIDWMSIHLLKLEDATKPHFLNARADWDAHEVEQNMEDAQ